MRVRLNETKENISLPKYRYRVETVRAGELLTASVYPVWEDGRRLPKEKRSLTCEAQKRENAKRAERRFTELVNANFKEGDIFMTLTHMGELPDFAEARADVRRFLMRAAYHYEREGVKDMRYIYVCESRTETDETRGRKKTRLHHHVFITGLKKPLSGRWAKKGAYTDRDLLERLWKKGTAESRYLKPGVYGPGLKNIAEYLMKDPHGKKRWGRSRNLKEPKITFSDSRVTPRKAFKMGTDYAFLEKQLGSWYPEHRISGAPEISFNSMNGAAYIYAVMERIRR